MRITSHLQHVSKYRTSSFIESDDKLWEAEISLIDSFLHVACGFYIDEEVQIAVVRRIIFGMKRPFLAQ